MDEEEEEKKPIKNKLFKHSQFDSTLITEEFVTDRGWDSFQKPDKKNDLNTFNFKDLNDSIPKD